MAWERRFRIASREKWLTILAALREMSVNFSEHPAQLIVRSERIPIQGWRRRLFHAVCSDVAPLWGVSPGEAKERVKTDFYGAEIVAEKGRLEPDEVIEFQRLLSKLGHYTLVLQSSEDSDDEEYARLVEHLYQMAAESGFHIPDRRTR